jgi:hypothetical protein
VTSSESNGNQTNICSASINCVTSGGLFPGASFFAINSYNNSGNFLITTQALLIAPSLAPLSFESPVTLTNLVTLTIRKPIAHAKMLAVEIQKATPHL